MEEAVWIILRLTKNIFNKADEMILEVFLDEVYKPSVSVLCLTPIICGADSLSQ